MLSTSGLRARSNPIPCTLKPYPRTATLFEFKVKKIEKTSTVRLFATSDSIPRMFLLRGRPNSIKSSGRPLKVWARQTLHWTAGVPARTPHRVGPTMENQFPGRDDAGIRRGTEYSPESGRDDPSWSTAVRVSTVCTISSCCCTVVGFSCTRRLYFFFLWGF